MKKIVSLFLKLITVVFAVLGTVFSVKAGEDAFMGGKLMLRYFTIQSNIALAVVCLAGFILLLSGKSIPKWCYVVKYIATISITVTGAVFCGVLAPTMGSAAWNAVNVFTHVIVPVACIADFFVSCADADIPYKDVFLVPLPLLAYAGYAGIGFVRNWDFGFGNNYPYFFLDWGSPAGAFGFSKELPFMGCGWWIVVLLVLVLLLGLLYLRIQKGIQKHRK